MSKYTISFLLGSFIVLVFSSCQDKSPVSLGHPWEIYAIADEQDWQAVGSVIEETLEKNL